MVFGCCSSSDVMPFASAQPSPAAAPLALKTLAPSPPATATNSKNSKGIVEEIKKLAQAAFDQAKTDTKHRNMWEKEGRRLSALTKGDFLENLAKQIHNAFSRNSAKNFVELEIKKKNSSKSAEAKKNSLKSETKKIHAFKSGERGYFVYYCTTSTEWHGRDKRFSRALQLHFPKMSGKSDVSELPDICTLCARLDSRKGASIQLIDTAIAYHMTIQNSAAGTSVLKILNTFKNSNSYVIYTELYPEQIFDLFERKPRLTEKTRLEIYTKMAACLKAVHTVMKVAHQDIKPENFLVRLNPTKVCLTDFDKGQLPSPFFRAPEVQMEYFSFPKPPFLLNPSADVWSLGIALYGLEWSLYPLWGMYLDHYEELFALEVKIYNILHSSSSNQSTSLLNAKKEEVQKKANTPGDTLNLKAFTEEEELVQTSDEKMLAYMECLPGNKEQKKRNLYSATPTLVSKIKETLDSLDSLSLSEEDRQIFVAIHKQIISLKTATHQKLFKTFDCIEKVNASSSPLGKLILDMLQVEPKKRPSSEEVHQRLQKMSESL